MADGSHAADEPRHDDDETLAEEIRAQVLDRMIDEIMIRTNNSSKGNDNFPVYMDQRSVSDSSSMCDSNADPRAQHTAAQPASSCMTPSSNQDNDKRSYTNHIGLRDKQLLEEGARHMQRNRDIKDKTAQIAKLRQELSRLKQEQKRHQRLCALRRDANVWWGLSRRDKWRKDTILAVLSSSSANPDDNSGRSLSSSSNSLPEALQSPNWEESAPASLQRDESIILAWLSREDWTGCPLFRCLDNLPKSYWRDVSFCEMMISKCPQLLKTHVPIYFFLDGGLRPQQLKEHGSENREVDSEKTENVVRLFRAWLKAYKLNRMNSRFHWHNSNQFIPDIDGNSVDPNSSTLDDAWLQWSKTAEVSPILDTFFGSPVIRNNAQLMLEFFQANLPLTTQDMTSTLLGPNLRDNAEFALKVAASQKQQGDCPGSRLSLLPPNVLCCFSHRLNKDFTVVHNFVAGNGNCLEYVIPALQKHYKIVQTAARQQPSALRFAKPGRTLDLLSNDAKFMKQLLKKSSNSPVVARLVFQCCGSRLLPRGMTPRPQDQRATTSSKPQKQGDRGKDIAWRMTRKEHPDAWDICLLASHIGQEFLPQCLRSNYQFWLQAAEERRLRSLSSVPKRFRRNVRILTALAVPFQLLTSRNSNGAAVVRRTPPSSGAFVCLEPSEIRHCFSHHTHFTTRDPMSALFCLIMYFKMRGGHSDEFFMAQLAKPEIANLFSEKDAMLRAIHLHAKSTLQWINIDLLYDDDIVRASLEAMGPAALEYIPDEVQMDHPALVAQAIRSDNHSRVDIGSHRELDDYENLPPGLLELTVGSSENDSSGLLHPRLLQQQREFEDPMNIWSMYNWIPEELFLHREVAISWVSRGGDYLHDEFDPGFEEDAELFLLIAKHNWCDFMFASESLLGNKEFMGQAVKVNGYVLREGRHGLSSDYDLALEAFADKPDLVDHYEWTSVGSPDHSFLTDFATHVRNRMSAHEAYIQFLMGIGRDGEIRRKDRPADECSGSCQLNLLRIGKETTNALARHIAEFAAVPTGRQLALLRKVSQNLAAYGF